jgi:transposase-like protein
MGEDTAAALAGAIRADEKQLRGHIDEAVRTSVEETLNGLLDAEADRICGAQRYERSADRSILERDITSASSRRRLARCNCGCRSCGTCRSRARSSSGIGAGKPLWRRRLSRCTG